MVISFLITNTAFASANLKIIRDVETENILKEISAPIFKSAGFGADDIRIILVESNDINAFVAGGANIFFYTGLIMAADNVEELAGVIAHETSHIASGHLIRSRQDIENASYQTILYNVLAAAAAIGTGETGAATAIATGGQNAAMRGFLKHTRSHESAADQGGVNFLNNANFTIDGMLSFLKKLEDQELLPASQQSEYIRTHPLTRDRISFLENKVDSSKNKGKKMPEKYQAGFDRIKMKLTGYLYPERAFLMKTTDRNTKYAKAVGKYRRNDKNAAIKIMDELIKLEPKNPYFQEFKGQILFENGKIDEAIPYYRKAIKLLPDSDLLRLSLAHALLQSSGKNNSKVLNEAIKNINFSINKDRKSARSYRLLSIAYGRLGNKPIAQLNLAEEALLNNKLDNADKLVNYSLKDLKKNSKDWIKANDLLAEINNRKQKNKK